MSFDHGKQEPLSQNIESGASLSYYDLMGNLPETVGISGMKTVASIRQGELYLRTALLGIGALAVWRGYGDVVPLLLYILHVVGTFWLRLYLERAPRQVPPRTYLMLGILDLVNVWSYAAVILYFGTSADISLTILAFFMFAGFYMHTLGRRSEIAVLLTNDIVTQVVILTVEIGWILNSYAVGRDPAFFSLRNTLILTFGGIALHLYFLLLCRNIRRARRDLQRAQHSRIVNERLLAIGQLSGGIAHDFNNMLTAVLGNIELYQLSTDPKEKDALICEAHTAARSGADLTAQLLAYARRAHLQPVRIDIGQALAHCEPRLRECLHGNQTLRLVVERQAVGAMVTLDRVQFCGVLAGLAENAADAMADDGVLTVSARRWSEPEMGVTVAVHDNGSGISPEILPLVFEPYFTTKPKGHGTGLGLAMARGIVEQSGGRMELVSEGGRGTTVLIHLPAAGANVGAVAKAQSVT
ncbi:sensor histidine kinase [Tropicibacter sp. S64]|uniref:sensor histidine kinase n=1 Tax=Tropicibacter sp. S64 TaxID=3415122 RepID=UPI003C7E9973